MDSNKMIKVLNRDNGVVGYKVPDLGIRRQFQGGEEKVVSFEELLKLSYIPGGRRILEEYLIVKDKDVLDELFINVEPEYNYTKKEIKELLLNGSEDMLLDCLDFAPEGVINLLQQIAVEIELNDMRKRNIILDKTSFNITSAIELKKASEENSSDNKTTSTTNRRTEALEVKDSNSIKDKLPTYNVVNKK